MGRRVTRAIILAYMEPVIQVQGLVKRYGSLTAVNDISFTVEAGETFGILGPNGAGKTTTLEIIEGLQQPTQGTACVLGMDVQRQSSHLKERIGVQLQAAAYFDHLTLTEILQLFGSFYRRSVPPTELLSKVGLYERRTSMLKRLSGGQKQAFTLAAALVNDPELVILDEPTTGLDPRARHDLWDLVRRIEGEGKTLVLTTHYMEEAAALCRRVAIMHQGRILTVGTPDELVSQLGAAYRVRVSAAAELPISQLVNGASEWVDRQQGDGHQYELALQEPAAAVQALLGHASEHGIQLERLEVLPATLEDVFLQLTGRGLQE